MNERVVAVGITCAVALASAIGMVMARRLVRCACLLLVHSLAMAATYMVLQADFLAMGQIVVYTGAIVILFLFVVLLLPQGGSEQPVTTGRMALAVAGGLVVLAALGASVADVLTAEPVESAVATTDLSTAAIARVLFGPQLVAFELTALLLLVAIIGAVVLWHRQGGEERR